ncbi:MAG: CDP-diacylglycerol--serine O-phosphatidyltransferase [Halofilum sp. (in: g-proteobacteria)]|nr:CDP-diacylglycerol--serine O-phosphatidyltransferase [Halofilum sp. (in: g-proteobacteria)]
MPEQEATKPRRGIYLLPSLFTTAALFAGFYAIIEALKHDFTTAAIAILVAMVLDGLDGRVARMTRTQSDFGAEYDSLSDMVSFGVAPALIVYEWSLSNVGEFVTQWSKLGWLAAFLYAACAALRLARFNTKIGTTDKRFFQGLASPSAAAIMVGMVWFTRDLGIDGRELMLAAFAVTVATGLLMVSNVPYYSFKDLGTGRRVPFVAILAVVMVFVFASIDPPKVIFAGFAVYGLSGAGVVALPPDPPLGPAHGGGRRHGWPGR